jgi:hypothetical protein
VQGFRFWRCVRRRARIRLAPLLLFASCCLVRDVVEAREDCFPYCWDYRYSRQAVIHLCRPFEINEPCPGPPWTLVLQKADGSSFLGLTELDEINLPPAPPTSWILAKRTGDERWVIYDLDRGQYRAEEREFASVLSIWRSRALGDPRLIQASQVESNLPRTFLTFRSRVEHWIWVSLMSAVFFWRRILLIMAAGMSIPGVLLIRDFRRHGRWMSGAVGVLLVGVGAALLMPIVWWSLQ